MNTLQKDRIIFLRKTGVGYGKIATELNLSLNTVKSFCRRNNLNIAPETQNSDLCVNCSTPLKHTDGAKKRRFCSNKCRTEWWNSHPEQVKQKAVYTFTCPHCKKSFTAYGNSHRKYCSHSCYISARFGGVGDE
jgi:endogenous inhibitor of DNA gyrase (YacG/DUF329 family)